MHLSHEASSVESVFYFVVRFTVYCLVAFYFFSFSISFNWY
jgi:hypothetical protein